MAGNNKISISIELVNTNIKAGLEQLKKLLNELRGAGAGAGGNADGTVFTALAWANTHVISLNFMYEAE